MKGVPPNQGPRTGPGEAAGGAISATGAFVQLACPSGLVLDFLTAPAQGHLEPAIAEEQPPARSERRREGQGWPSHAPAARWVRLTVDRPTAKGADPLLGPRLQVTPYHVPFLPGSAAGVLVHRDLCTGAGGHRFLEEIHRAMQPDALLVVHHEEPRGSAAAPSAAEAENRVRLHFPHVVTLTAHPTDRGYALSPDPGLGGPGRQAGHLLIVASRRRRPVPRQARVRFLPRPEPAEGRAPLASPPAGSGGPREREARQVKPQEQEVCRQALDQALADNQRLRQVVGGLREQLSQPPPELGLARRALADEQARSGRLAARVQQLQQALTTAEQERARLRQELFAAQRRCDDLAEETASYALEAERLGQARPQVGSSRPPA